MDQKTEYPGIYKSPEGFIINKDNDALQAYKNRKAKEMKIYQVEDELSKMKSDISEIKELLKGLVK